MEVFDDDFIAMTNNLTTAHLRRLSRCMLHGVHSIFPPPEVTNHVGGDSIVEKKLHKEEGRWQIEKEILGWIINGHKYTIRLPEDKIDNILLFRGTAD